MRRKDKEITNEQVIREILEKSAICRLGIVDNNEAYIVPVYFCYSEGYIYCHSAQHGRKIDILNRNNRVTFEIEYSNEIIKKDTACEWSAKYRSVMGRGTVFFENDSHFKEEALAMIMVKYGAVSKPVFNQNSLDRTVILKIKIDSLSGKESGQWD
jgi:nitroimidazol reductase NimA-like FMN-containing flavoprotein (pyridoxamine 5'-phosphate oxidase superfamily)